VATYNGRVDVVYGRQVEILYFFPSQLSRRAFLVELRTMTHVAIEYHGI
jgi:hypothetical protein